MATVHATLKMPLLEPGAGAGHTSADSAPKGEDSPAYYAFAAAGLVTSRYRLSSVEQVDCVASNTDRVNNTLLRSALLPASFLCLPLGGPCCFYSAVHEVEVPDGSVRAFQDGKGGFGFFGPGLHRLVNPWLRVDTANAKLSQGVIRNGDRCLVTVPQVLGPCTYLAQHVVHMPCTCLPHVMQGQIGFALDMGQPILLPPGLHQWRSSTMEFQEPE